MSSALAFIACIPAYGTVGCVFAAVAASPVGGVAGYAPNKDFHPLLHLKEYIAVIDNAGVIHPAHANQCFTRCGSRHPPILGAVVGGAGEKHFPRCSPVTRQLDLDVASNPAGAPLNRLRTANSPHFSAVRCQDREVTSAQREHTITGIDRARILDTTDAQLRLIRYRGSHLPVLRAVVSRAGEEHGPRWLPPSRDSSILTVPGNPLAFH